MKCSSIFPGTLLIFSYQQAPLLIINYQQSVKYFLLNQSKQLDLTKEHIPLKTLKTNIDFSFQAQSSMVKNASLSLWFMIKMVW